MEEWTNLAKTVPGTVFKVGFDIDDGLLGAVDTTRSKLDALAIALQGRRNEAARGDIGDNLATLLGGASPSLPFEDLDRAIRELARLNALHARAGNAFLLYGEHAGLEGGDNAQWLGWRQHHAAAVHHAQAALQRLRAAASRARAVEDAIRTARSCPHGSPCWDGWMEAAVDLATYAKISAAMALRTLRRMGKAIGQEFHDAWNVTNPS